MQSLKSAASSILLALTILLVLGSYFEMYEQRKKLADISESLKTLSSQIDSADRKTPGLLRGIATDLITLILPSLSNRSARHSKTREQETSGRVSSYTSTTANAEENQQHSAHSQSSPQNTKNFPPSAESTGLHGFENSNANAETTSAMPQSQKGAAKLLASIFTLLSLAAAFRHKLWSTLSSIQGILDGKSHHRLNAHTHQSHNGYQSDTTETTPGQDTGSNGQS